MFYCYFRSHARLKFDRETSKDEDETPFRYAHTDIRTQMLVYCGLMHYRLDHAGTSNAIITIT